MAKLNGYLDDYAYLAHGLLCLHDATGDKKWLDEAKKLTDVMLKFYHDEKAGGFYNGSKVLRAGADRELTIVAAPAAQLAHDEVAAEIDELAGDLAAAGYPSWFGRQLGVTAAAVRADESIPFQSAPPAWSCRVCGELFLDIPPTTCPTCEAPAIGFRNHEAVWYLEPSDRSSTVDALAHGPSQIGRVLEGRTDEQLDRRPRPAEWSARETLEHITGAEELLSA